jgi:proteic killer suppression protein
MSPMEIRFHTSKLRRCFEDSGRAVREWGADVGTRYVQRLLVLQASERLDDVYENRAFDLHPLRGDRRGQYAIRLTGAVRLIVTADADRRGVTVEEVTDYHG